MAFQSVPETAEIIIRYTGYGSNMVNVLAARKTGGYDLADIFGLATAVDALVAADWLEIQTEDVTYEETTVRGLENPNDFEFSIGTSSGTGEIIDLGVSGNVTLSIKKASGLTGRSARGRTYWIGLARGQLSANKNLVDTATVTLIEAAMELMRVGIITQGWTPVIVSRFTGGVERDPATTFPWIGSVAVDNEVDSQRRRLLG